MIPYDTSEILLKLEKLGNGSHKCGFWGGWIYVEKKSNGFEVMWTSGKDYHSPFMGNAYSVFFSQGISDVYESALSMHHVNVELRCIYIADFLAKKIKKASKS